jgi:hypothetical protein
LCSHILHLFLPTSTAEEEVASVHNVMDSDGFGHDGLEADMVDHEADASTMAAYKRGKRYKRLCKMLTGKEVSFLQCDET